MSTSPVEPRWGEQTRLAVRNFPISGEQMPLALIRAIAMVKAEAAAANLDAGVVPDELAGAIVRAAAEVIDGIHDDQFPVDVFQTGSGTSTNMNVNEVIAHRSLQTTWCPPRSSSPPRSRAWVDWFRRWPSCTPA